MLKWALSITELWFQHFGADFQYNYCFVLSLLLVAMDSSIISLILILVVIVEIIILIFTDHKYFGAYIDIIVLCLFILAGYFVYRYLQINKKIPLRAS